jgi:hypothetical protein
MGAPERPGRTAARNGQTGDGSREKRSPAQRWERRRGAGPQVAAGEGMNSAGGFHNIFLVSNERLCIDIELDQSDSWPNIRLMFSVCGAGNKSEREKPL